MELKALNPRSCKKRDYEEDCEKRLKKGIP
jgi:hypothetical protein